MRKRYKISPDYFLYHVIESIKDRRRKIKSYSKKGLSFSLDDLRKFAYKDNVFLGMYKKWQMFNYDWRVRPTIDRIDNKRGYHLDNIQFLTSMDNLNKDKQEWIKKKNVKVKCVETGNVYESMKKATRELSLPLYGISKCICGRRKSTGGYHWKKV